MDTGILISIVIPVKNGEYWLETLFQRLMRQTLASRTEIIVIDSGSTDRSREIAARYPIRLITISPGEFNHGETRNLGVKAAKGKYVVFTVQDALPQNDEWLASLLDGFTDEDVAGVCGQQIVPHDLNKNPVSWFRPIDGPAKTKYIFQRPQDFISLPPEEKKIYCGWDNVNAAYRREILERIPFRKIRFAEDAQWASDALSGGYGIVYSSFARVYHYHYDSPAVIYRRVFEECYARYILFGLIPEKEPVLKKGMRDLKVLLLEKKLSFSMKISWFIYNFRIRMAANRSIAAFNKYRIPGDDHLNRQYEKLCGKPQHAVAPAGKGS